MTAPMAETEEQRLAEAVGESLFERDRASQALGMTVDRIAPGLASVSMIVREDMLNGHQTCHGGLIFTLADSAFAFACNACNRATVALAAQISFTEPARLGDRLIATAIERSRTRRTGVYDVEVTSDDGRLIATFRGNAYETKGDVLTPPSDG